MVTKTELLKRTPLERVKAQPQIQQVQVQQTPQQIEQPVSSAQQEYNRLLEQYENQKAEADNWRRAWSLIQRGKAYATRGDPELAGKVTHLQMLMAFGRMKELERLQQTPSQPIPPQYVQTAPQTFHEVQPSSPTLFQKAKMLFQTSKLKSQRRISEEYEARPYLQEAVQFMQEHPSQSAYKQLDITEPQQPEPPEPFSEIQPLSEKDIERLEFQKKHPIVSKVIDKFRNPTQTYTQLVGRMTPKTNTFLDKPAPSWGLDLLDFYLKSGVFSPYMMTGSVKKGSRQKLEEPKIKYQRKFSSEDYQELLSDLRANTKQSDLRELYRKALLTKDQTKIKQMEEVIRNVYAPTKTGQTSAEALLKDVRTQELQTTSFIQQPQADFEPPPIMVRTAEAQTTAKTLEDYGRPSMVSVGSQPPLETPSKSMFTGRAFIEEDVFYDPASIENLTSKTSSLIGSDSLMVSKTNLMVTQGLSNLTKQKPQIKQDLLIRQKEDLSEKQKQVQRQDLFLKTAQKLTQETKQDQTFKQKVGLKNPFKPQRPKPKPPIVPIPLLKPSGDERRRVKRRIKKPVGFFGEIKRFGKWKPITRPTSFSKAFGVSKRRVKETLGASLRIKTTTGRLVGLPTSKRFRRSKKDPFSLVEKRRFRLNAPKELQEIQFWKKIKTKTKTKSKSNKFKW